MTWCLVRNRAGKQALVPKSRLQILENEWAYSRELMHSITCIPDSEWKRLMNHYLVETIEEIELPEEL